MNNDRLILLHGWGMNACVFDPLLQRLDSARASFVPALPGYPGSPWQEAGDFEAQLERMAAEMPAGHLLGWSLGGIYAIELALRYPQKFSALTLVACNPCFVKQPGWCCAMAASVFEGFSAALEADWRHTLRRFLALQMRGESEARSLSRELWQQLLGAGQPGIPVLRFGLDLLKYHDARAALGEVRQPLKLILGERDLLVPIAIREQIADVAPEIQVESVAGAAHAPFLSHPTQVAALL